MMFLVVDGGPLGWVDMSVNLIMTSGIKSSLDYGTSFGIATAKGCPCVAGKHGHVLVLVFVRVMMSQKEGKKEECGKMCWKHSLQYYFATIIIIINYFKMAFKLCGAGADWLPSGFIKQHPTSRNSW